jgi:folate-binding protein YgfZ
MTETDVAFTIQASSLAGLLESTGTKHELKPYLGVLTPREFDARAREIAALASEAAVHDMGWLQRVAVRGEDRFRWLSGMVTNMVNDLGAQTGAWNLVLNAQGRLQGDLTAWRERDEAGGDELELEIAADQYEKLMAHLNRFIIMDDVELVPLSGEVALGLTGPAADDVLGRIGLAKLAEPMTMTRVEWNGFDVRIVRAFGTLAAHYELWVPVAGFAKMWKFLTTAGSTPVGCEAVEAFRIAEGIPLYGVDMAEKDLPQETSQIRALHFTKGCYLGQEIVERIRSRGNVHRHLRALELAGPLPAGGSELMVDGKAAGVITSAAELPLAAGSRTFALGMIRGEVEARNETLSYTVGTDTGQARILAEAPKLN